MPVRLLASFLGLLNSFSKALGQVVRLMTRQLYKCLSPAHNSLEKWNANTSLSSEAKVELEFWRSKIKKLNGFSIKPVIPSITMCELVAGDASREGSYMVKFSDKSKTLLSRKFTEFERQQSSELRCL